MFKNAARASMLTKQPKSSYIPQHQLPQKPQLEHRTYKSNGGRHGKDGTSCRRANF